MEGHFRRQILPSRSVSAPFPPPRVARLPRLAFRGSWWCRRSRPVSIAAQLPPLRWWRCFRPPRLRSAPTPRERLASGSGVGGAGRNGPPPPCAPNDSIGCVTPALAAEGGRKLHPPPMSLCAAPHPSRSPWLASCAAPPSPVRPSPLRPRPHYEKQSGRRRYASSHAPPRSTARQPRHRVTRPTARPPNRPCTLDLDALRYRRLMSDIECLTVGRRDPEPVVGISHLTEFKPKLLNP